MGKEVPGWGQIGRLPLSAEKAAQTTAAGVRTGGERAQTLSHEQGGSWGALRLHLSLTHTGHTHGNYRSNGAGRWGRWDLLSPHIFLKVAILSSEQGPPAPPRLAGLSLLVSIPFLAPSTPHLHPGAVPVSLGQYLMPQSS